MFQSLFYWKSRSKLLYLHLSYSVLCVSILILLEKPQQVEIRLIISIFFQRFNPYFIGKAVARISRRRVQTASDQVSILILLEKPQQAVGVTPLDGDFYCFNPYFIGKAVARNPSATIAPFSEQFQSLFYWKSRSKSGSSRQFWRPSMFQSLFYWKSRSKYIEELGIMRLNKFQSLFYWKSRSKFIAIICA